MCSGGAKEGVFVSFVVPRKAPGLCRLKLWLSSRSGAPLRTATKALSEHVGQLQQALAIVVTKCWLGGKVSSWKTYIATPPVAPTLGRTRKPWHASFFRTHSDTQTVPTFHCIRMSKHICFETRVLRTHRHAAYLKKGPETLAFLETLRHVRLRFSNARFRPSKPPPTSSLDTRPGIFNNPLPSPPTYP